MMAIAKHRKLLEDIIPENQYSLEFGIFPVRLLVDHIWTIVIVDGHFPILPNETPYFARYYGELWPNIIEKAVAKVIGGYHKLAGGIPADAFRSLTGASSISYMLGPDTDHGRLWDRIQFSLSSGFLITLSTNQTDIESYENFGLAHSHVYSLIETSIADDRQLFLIGTTIWRRWNGKCSELVVYPEDVTKNWEKSKKKMANQRLFWMEIDDFCKWFLLFTVCRYREGWDELRINGCHGEKSLYLHVSHRCQITIEISLSDPKMWEYHDVGFIFVIDDIGKLALCFSVEFHRAQKVKIYKNY
ncbi:hypothetical protein B9Z55_003067 [Caenorhabditis nigoni]|nr:hypothetical protein B9Z55_003067 [Caenorhabditis nigoni]